MSLRTLAAAVAISPAQLSQIETGKAALDVELLTRLAVALGWPPSSFLPSVGERHFFIDRAFRRFDDDAGLSLAVELPRAEREPYHNRFWPLAEPYCGKRLEPYRALVGTSPGAEPSFITSEPETFAFVLKGSLEFRAKTGDTVQVEELSAGDAIWWHSYLTHSTRALGKEPAWVVCVGYAPGGSPDVGMELLHEPTAGHPILGARASAGWTQDVGHRIGYLRRSHGLSLAQVAKVLGISARRLAAIESGERAPRLSVLYRFARAFRRPIQFFLPVTLDEGPAFSIVRAADVLQQPPFTVRAGFGDRTTLYRPLAERTVGRALHPYYVQLSSKVDDAQQYPGEELVHVLNGEVELSMEGTLERLGPGDSLYLDTSIPHRLRAIAESPFTSHGAEMILVHWSPSGELRERLTVRRHG